MGGSSGAFNRSRKHRSCTNIRRVRAKAGPRYRGVKGPTRSIRFNGWNATGQTGKQKFTFPVKVIQGAQAQVITSLGNNSGVQFPTSTKLYSFNRLSKFVLSSGRVSCVAGEKSLGPCKGCKDD